MKGTIKLLLVVMTLVAPAAVAETPAGVTEVITALRNIDCWQAKIKYSVTLPQTDIDIDYQLNIESALAPGDPLSPCRYIIDWTLPTPAGPTTGFSAYFDGNHYRYRQGSRLQEYHMTWDSIPFRPNGRADAVQRTAQFTDLIPTYIADQLAEMATDSTYTLAVKKTKEALAIDVKRIIDSQCIMERTYKFRTTDLWPTSIYTESNPGSITEQTVNLTYAYPDSPTPCKPMSEQRLIQTYPDTFGKFRESNFKIENLRGQPMPTFSLPTSTAERYSYQKGTGFASPTAIAIMEIDGGFNTQMVHAIRKAVDALPIGAQIIWVFMTNNVDAVENVIPQLRTGETLLVSGRSLARDCGVASFPVVILAGTDGIVKNVILGFNPQMQKIVIQEMSLLK